jgi:two-component system sensor histidine kinase DesK
MTSVGAVTAAATDVPGEPEEDGPPEAPGVVESLRAGDPWQPAPPGWRGAALPALLAGVWLVYLAQPLQEILHHDGRAWRTVGVLAIVVFSLAYVGVFFQIRRRRWSALPGGADVRAFALDRVSASLVAVMLVCFVLTVPSAGSSSLAALVYLVATVMMLTPLWFGWSVSVLAVVASEAAAFLVPGWDGGQGAGLAILLASVAVFGLRLAFRRSQQLSIARDDLARLVVQEERNRFARDLHDILGHSLTVVAMKAELAGRLVRIDPAGAEREIGDVERLTREALVDVRSAVAGYRGVTLAGELANSRAALRAAGIIDELPTAVDEVPGDRRALFGWVVREGVTNVVRHSGARRCTVTVTPTSVEVRDDGHGRVDRPSGAETALHPGHGLVGLSERAHAVAGRLSTMSTAEGFVLRVELPAPPGEPGPAAQPEDAPPEDAWAASGEQRRDAPAAGGRR